MSKTQFSHAELRRKLSDQRTFLEASARAFDSGTEIEALRLAVTARVLLHETPSSHALLNQLGLLADLSLPNTGNSFPSHVEYSADEQFRTTRVGVFLRLASMRLCIPPESARFVPKLTEVRSAPRSLFSDWWVTPILRAPGADIYDAPRELTRKDLVLGLANKEGGAHVDPNPSFNWWIATRSSAYGKLETTSDGKPKWSIPTGELARGGDTGEIVTPVYASMRAIAEELCVALDMV